MALYTTNRGRRPRAPVSASARRSVAPRQEAQPAAQPTSVSAATNPALDALLGRYNKYVDELHGGTGRAMDIAGQKFRDIREGGRRGLTEGAAQRGVASTPELPAYEAATARGEQQAVADVGLEREAREGSMILGGLGVARAPAEMAIAEKGLSAQIGAQQQQAALAESQQNLNAFLALLGAYRSSPAVGPTPMVGGGGGGGGVTATSVLSSRRRPVLL